MPEPLDIDLVEKCFKEFGSHPANRAMRVLDFGCGEGHLVNTLRQRGYDALGCDLLPRWASQEGYFQVVGAKPYRLPYPDESFDFVVSIGVFEHVTNKHESFKEIHRVLRTGGVTAHLFPSKYYLPYEPHVFVPLLNILGPAVPTWYLAMWALAGVRNPRQRTMTWREVVADNKRFSRETIAYWSSARYRDCVERIFGNCTFAMPFLVSNSRGRASKLARTLFGQRIGGALFGLFRYSLLIARKDSNGG